MTKNINSKKDILIKEIASISSEQEIDKLIMAIKIVRLSDKHGTSIFEESKSSISVEVLKRQQQFSGIDKTEFNRLVDELDIEESINELLAMVD
jgi:hypothetical protein